MTLREQVMEQIVYAKYPWLRKRPDDHAIKEFRRLEAVNEYVAEYHAKYNGYEE